MSDHFSVKERSHFIYIRQEIGGITWLLIFQPVAKNSADFTGRAWLLEPVLDWLKTAPATIHLTGEPGAGKSMIAPG